MEIRKHKVDNVWIFGEYDFYVDNKLVAQLRNQLVGTDYVYLYFLPDLYNCTDRTRIDLRYMTYNEVIKKETNIVVKKLYLITTNVLSEIKKVEIIEE